ncbi:MAG: hypothetical protein KIPDCIKN_03342 [Haliscomenobacter sp.]|jgi:hypothetical protein|nr:hypothetical protein [Haliscomenobacter sp.]
MKEKKERVVPIERFALSFKDNLDRFIQLNLKEGDPLVWKVLLNFRYQEDFEKPSYNYSPKEKVIVGYLPYLNFRDFWDLLRMEKTLSAYFKYTESSAGTIEFTGFRLLAAEEAVGEEEWFWKQEEAVV